MNGLLGESPFGVQSVEAHTGIASGLSNDQLKRCAALDIRYFVRAYPNCPNCGVEFAKCHPAYNLYPHWTGACARTKSESVKSVTSATRSSGIRRFFNKFL
jgi:hypothetical protein